MQLGDTLPAVATVGDVRSSMSAAGAVNGRLASEDDAAGCSADVAAAVVAAAVAAAAEVSESRDCWSFCWRDMVCGAGQARMA